MGGAIGTIVKLFLLCVAVGLIMAWFDIRPENLLENFGETVVGIYNWVIDSIRWAVPYALLGAVIVLPIYGLMRINSFMADRKIKKLRRDQQH